MRSRQKGKEEENRENRHSFLTASTLTVGPHFRIFNSKFIFLFCCFPSFHVKTLQLWQNKYVTLSFLNAKKRWHAFQIVLFPFAYALDSGAVSGEKSISAAWFSLEMSLSTLAKRLKCLKVKNNCLFWWTILVFYFYRTNFIIFVFLLEAALSRGLYWSICSIKSTTLSKLGGVLSKQQVFIDWYNKNMSFSSTLPLFAEAKELGGFKRKEDIVKSGPGCTFGTLSNKHSVNPVTHEPQTQADRGRLSVIEHQLRCILYSKRCSEHWY